MFFLFLSRFISSKNECFYQNHSARIFRIHFTAHMTVACKFHVYHQVIRVVMHGGTGQKRD